MSQRETRSGFQPTPHPQVTSVATRRGEEIGKICKVLDRPISRILVFSDGVIGSETPFARSLGAHSPISATVHFFPMNRMSAMGRVTRSSDVVIVVASSLSDEGKHDVVESLAREFSGAAFRGLFAGQRQEKPEEVARPHSRRIIGHNLHQQPLAPTTGPEPTEPEVTPQGPGRTLGRTHPGSSIRHSGRHFQS